MTPSDTKTHKYTHYTHTHMHQARLMASKPINLSKFKVWHIANLREGVRTLHSILSLGNEKYRRKN